MRKRGITLIEILVVLAIVAIISAIIYPLISKTKMSSKVAAAKLNLKVFWQGLELYRQDNDEKVEFGPLDQMGLPSAGMGYVNFIKQFTKDPTFTWEKHREYSPCGATVNNEIFHGLLYFGNLVDQWPEDVQRYKADTIVLADKNCNDSTVNIECQFCEKRSIGIALSGQIHDKRSSDRVVFDQRFYR